MKYLFAGVITMASLLLVLGDNTAGEKAKYTIPEVMAKAHKGANALMPKVAKGKASDAEKKELVELYTALSKNEPPKGDAADWKAKTKALVEAATKAADGDEAAAKKLPNLAACAACHKAHKG